MRWRLPDVSREVVKKLFEDWTVRLKDGTVPIWEEMATDGVRICASVD